MGSVISRPPSGATLNSGGTGSGEEDFEWEGSLVAGVCPQAVVPGCDSQTGEEVVDNSENAGLDLERYPIRCHHPHKRDEDNEVRVQPVDMFVPVIQGNGCFGDVCRREESISESRKPWGFEVPGKLTRLLEVVLLSSKRNKIGGAIRERLSLDGGRGRRHLEAEGVMSNTSRSVVDR